MKPGTRVKEAVALSSVAYLLLSQLSYHYSLIHSVMLIGAGKPEHLQI
jgi:hypothetical protein